MKYDLIAEAYVTLLIEGRIDDLKTQNPHLVNEIDSYANQDPTPQKKFVPWLVSQHKKGNVTPDDPSLSETLSGFETYKSKHGIRDHSSKSYQEIRDAVSPHLGTAATNKELKKQQIHEGIDQIYSSSDNKIQAFHVKTKEASQHVYGGGKHLGGLHTDWCVAARSDDCLFGDYGTMYTIHAKDDPKSPYAVHPDQDTHGIITTRDNNPDEYPIDEGLKKFPHLKDAIDKIKAEHPNILLNELKKRDVNYNTLQIAALHPNPEVAIAALNHPYFDDIDNSALHPNPKVALAALNHHKATYQTVYNAAKHPDPNVAITALNHPRADKQTYFKAAEHPNTKVLRALLNMRLSNGAGVYVAIRHPDPDIAMMGLKHPYASKYNIESGLNHPDKNVREFAANALQHNRYYR